MKKSLIITVAAACLTACGGGNDNREAAGMLAKARAALSQKHYAEAKDTILSMRKRFPEAIEARRQGILLLDSVELEAAADSMRGATGPEWERLDVKRQFFERKLEEDKRKDNR